MESIAFGITCHKSYTFHRLQAIVTNLGKKKKQNKCTIQRTITLGLLFIPNHVNTCNNLLMPNFHILLRILYGSDRVP